MRKSLYIFVFFCLCALCAHAETIVLRTGARVAGTIVFQNEEVIIVREAESGARFQYPRADVEAVLSDEEANAAEGENGAKDEEQEITTSKKASILLELAGGAAVNPGTAAGGAASADLLVGSHHIGDKHLFIGGGIGYHGMFLGAEKYSFLPIQVAVRMPFMETKHAPVFGFSAGYGVALSKNYLGGIYAGVDLGYRCQLNPKTAIALVAFAQFQQAKITTVTVIGEDSFEAKAGRNLVASGVKLCLYF
ncbi:MAG: hypothetical protein II457_03890 [Paludibacteraceae bacterium]|nr:hypothetical protein [Paludibacteraceae bacterium]